MDRFHSTVLRPPHEEGSNGAASAGDDRGPRGQLRDILNQNAATGPPAAPEPPRPQSSSFNLRSPTHHPPPFSASPSSSSINGSHSTPAAPRSILNNHFMPPSAGAPSSLTAPSLAAPSAVLPSAGPSGGAPGGLQAPPPHSPLHPPSVYYPKDIRPDRESTREKPAAGSFYDPTTDTTKERRVSDNGAWHNNNTTTSAAAPASTPKSREPYNYRSSDYYNGGYSSPVASTFPPRSPVSHSHPPPPAGSLSPSDRAVPISSSNARNAPMPGTNGATPAPGASSTTRTESPAPSSNPPAASTPSRAGVMSLSNMLSSSDPPSKPDMEAITPGPIKVRSDKAEKPEKADKLDKAEKPEKADKPDKSDKPGKPEKPEKPEKTPKAEKASKSDKTDKPEKPEKTPKAEKTAKSDNAEKPAADEIEKLETPAKEKKAPRRTAKSRASGIRNSESTPKPSSRRSSAKLETPTSTKAPLKRQVNGHPKHKTFSAEKERKIKELMDQFDSQAEDIGETDFDEELSAWKARSLRRRLEMENRDSSKHQVRRNDFTTHEMQKLKIHADLGKRRYDDLYYEEALREVRETELHLEKERKKDMQRKRRREKSMATTIAQENAARARALNAQDETERQKHLREAERASKKVQQTKLILEKGIKGPARNLGPIEPNLEGGTMATFQAENMEPGKSKGKNRTGARPKKSKEQKQAEKDNAEAAQAALDAGEELPSKEESSKIRIKLNKKGAKEDGDKENKEPKGKDKDAAEEPKDPLETKFQSKGFNQIYDQIWRDLARKDVSKVYRLATDSYATKGSNLKKTAILASKEAKRWQLRTNKGHKDLQARAKRVMRDMMGFWKRNEREERDLRKAAEKQELENARKEEADREAARQKRKLNFLISQTELYSHFIGKKIKTDEVERSTDHPDEAAKDKAEGKTEATNGLNVEEPSGPVGSKVTNFEDLDFDAEDESTLRAAAMANAQNAIAEAQQKARDFNKDANLDEDGEMNFQNPTGMGEVEIEQPKLLNCQLKEYQLKGLNWLANLYEQGINGILADEMGLGKTVQSISVMAYLAEKYDIWGPFLVVAPASTLHNWQQEITKFVPQFKVLPYWGTAADRKVLRKFWDRKHHTYKKEAAFHVMITSYQLVVSDVAYFQKMKWQYMILDEAQAIKSSQSSRWKCLLSFHCRNRLLLTGTPIQNNMQELWALLHFIMPSLFDSHDEFSEWFSKDIESHAQSNTKLNEDQLKRLHMILKPFMLRRVKKHVQKELGDKIELDVFCDLTYRQRALYSNLRNQISIMDLIEKATLGDDDSASLMNLVMQFRKVCNHPDLFERADIKSPFFTGYFAETGSFLREGNNIPVGYSTRSLIGYQLPRLVWREGGRLHLPGKDNQKAGFRNKHLDHMMNIWAPDNISESLGGQDNFSFLRFADTSPQEAYHVSHQDIFTRAVKLSQKKQRLANMSVVYDDPGSGTENWTPAHALLNVRERGNRKALADVTSEGILSNLMNVSRTSYEDTGVTRLEQAGCARALAAPIEVLCDSHATRAERDHVMFNPTIRKALFGPTPIEELALVTQKVPFERYPPPALLPPPDSENKRFNNITVPSMRRFVTDSGKLAKLDELLRTLKEGGHRVLLYFQMTRMIDLIEEYLTYRNYKYCRLDGSTKLEDRRDTVADFQTRPEIFIFLLSTRAGGLGINLTSADTVIFYDSDWNPTIDSQAMDRAHRLGQTRQVTVYRLITRGTIEERIRKRAMQKEEVQRVVIQGGGSSATGGGVDFSGRRPPENRSRDIAMWLADDEQAELIERREKELLESGEFDKAHKKRGGGKRKRADVSLDEMYHEGEGNFDDNKASGTATPVDEVRPGKKKRGPPGSKKAKTAKQRLAIADGEIDI